MGIVWDSDGVFFGMSNEGGNRKDAIIGWGDDPQDNLRFLFNGAEKVRISSDGNVGIGTANPGAKLQIEEGDLLLQGGTGGTSKKIIFKTSDNGDVAKYIGTEAYWTVIGAHGNEGWKFKDNSGDIVMQINGIGGNNGNVGIGTTSPSHKLAVNGTVRAKEVIVDTGWSDYVFKPGYRLASLSEVEGAIKRDGHLPGIPSAAEVEQGGVSLGDMQARMMAKVEELTLHVIAQEKRNDAQQAEIAALRAENAEFRHQLSKTNLHQ